MLQKLLHTNNDIAPLILRITIGGVVFGHGMQKLPGWFGGHGPMATMASFHEWYGIPYFITFLVIMSDFFGALLVIAGLATRFAASCIGLVMLGAIYFAHGRWGFYMNWYAERRGEGFEFHLLVLGIVLALIVTGGGKWSVDGWLEKKLGSKEASEEA